jgi:hypothetical protein
VRSRLDAERRPARGRSRALLLAVVAASGCAAGRLTAVPSDSGAHRRDGAVAIAATSRESGETVHWEKGALTRGAEVTAFTVRGLEVGASGFEDLVVVGDVYDLDRPEQFAGTYERVVAEIAPADDSPATLLGNEHGVLLLLRSADGESAVGPGPEGVVVELAR